MIKKVEVVRYNKLNIGDKILWMDKEVEVTKIEHGTGDVWLKLPFEITSTHYIYYYRIHKEPKEKVMLT